MSSKTYKAGTILSNKLKEFTKVISEKNGIYGISGWVRRESDAKKATVATKFINKFGLKYAGVKIVKAGSKTEDAPSDVEETAENGDENVIDLTKAKGDELKAYAEENDIDISDLDKVKDIRERVIEASQNEAAKLEE